MTIRILPLIFAALFATSAQAQLWPPRLPVINRGAPPRAATMPMTPGALQADLVVKAGSDTVYFSRRGHTLDGNAIARLTAQARWLLANPMVSIRLEGHGDERDTRDYALAIGDRRAHTVRDFLVLQGVVPHRITMLSWGKERPGSVRIGPSVVVAGPRVKTIIR
ncbi:MAG: OmpA family protein [Sphingomicrobium sp.]